MNDTKDVVRKFLEELDRQGPGVDLFVDPGCRVFLPGNPEALDRKHFSGFIEMLYAAFPDLRHPILDQIAEGNRVVTLVGVMGGGRAKT